VFGVALELEIIVPHDGFAGLLKIPAQPRRDGLGVASEPNISRCCAEKLTFEPGSRLRSGSVEQ
jgi:hypothetical protein